MDWKLCHVITVARGTGLTCTVTRPPAEHSALHVLNHSNEKRLLWLASVVPSLCNICSRISQHGCQDYMNVHENTSHHAWYVVRTPETFGEMRTTYKKIFSISFLIVLSWPRTHGPGQGKERFFFHLESNPYNLRPDAQSLPLKWCTKQSRKEAPGLGWSWCSNWLSLESLFDLKIHANFSNYSLTYPGLF